MRLLAIRRFGTVEPVNGPGRFLRELQRRKVYRATVAYAVVAWGVIEVADLALPRLGLPDAAITFVIVAALLGLPLAIILAWAYETTPDGIAREGETRGEGGDASAGTYAAAALTVAIVGLAAWWIVADRPAADAGAPPGGVPIVEKSVAVLPFQVSASADEGWLGEGLASEIHGALTRVPDLDLVAWQSSSALAAGSIDEIGERLGVTHVLAGTVRTRGEVARLRAELTAVDGHEVLWSRDFQAPLATISSAQERIARLVVDALEVELGTVDPSQMVRGSTTSREAREHHWRGLQQWDRRSESAILSAIDHFRRAVTADSLYAAAWAGLAYAYLILPEYSPAADVASARAQSAAAAENALRLDPDQTDALTAMGWGRMIHDYDWAGAEELIGRALALDSTNVRALHWHSHVVSWQGRHAEAIALARKATDVDPLSPIMRQNLAFILMEAREYDAALRELDRNLSSNPDFAVSRRSTWNVYTRAGRTSEAARALQGWLLALEQDPDDAAALAAEFEAARARFLDSGEPSTLTRDLVDRLRPGIEVAGQLYAAVGDRETTLELLERAYRERAGSRNLLSVKVNPLFDFLRDEPRFQDLVRRVGL